MEFCEVCDNLLYAKVEDNKLLHQCNYCGTVADRRDTGAPIVETLYMDDKAKYEHLMTPLLKHDITLPRLREKECPACSKQGGVFYVKYDDVNLKFLYSCSLCSAFWGPKELGDWKRV